MKQMIKQAPLTIIMIIIFLFSAGSQVISSQGNRVTLNPSSITQQPEIQIIEASSQLIRYRITIPALDTAHLSIDQQKYNQWFIEGFN